MSLKDLIENEGVIQTSMGRSFLSKRVVFRGKDLHWQLRDKSWIELYAMGITGQEFNEDEVKLLNYIWLSTSYPDKSIWPNHITALAGSARTTPALAISAGIASCDATIFGGKPFRTGIDFFIRAGNAIEDRTLQNFVEEEIQKHNVIYGYGRPLTSTDERVPHIIKFIEALDIRSKKHFNIAIEVANILKRLKEININVAAVYAAIGADLGFTPKQFHTFMTLCFVAGMPPCFLEASENKEGTFLPVRCDSIEYCGAAKRKW